MFCMEDENEEYIEPRRIRHCPGDIIEVMTNINTDYTPPTLPTPPTIHVKGMTAPGAATAATVPGSVHPRPVSSGHPTNKAPILTSPPLHNKQPPSPLSPPPSSPSPSATSAAVSPQTKDTQKPPSAHQSRPAASSPSPEPDFEFVDKASVEADSLPKKVPLSHNLRQLVKKCNGIYDEKAQKIALTLTSSSFSKQFFEGLVKDGKGTKELDVALAYDFGAYDSMILVNRVYKTDIALLRLDLKGTWEEQPKLVKKGDKPKYFQIHTLLWNKTLKGLILENATHFGERTNLPPKNNIYSNLRLLHLLFKIESSSEAHLCTIIGACPNLHDLRVGNFQSPGEMHLKMEQVIGNLKKLKILHIYNTTFRSTIPAEDMACPRWKTIPQSDKPIKNIVRTGRGVNQARLQEVLGRSACVIEVLMLQYPNFPNLPLELRTSATTLNPTAQKIVGQPYAKLTHLDLQVILSTDSQARLRLTLPRLNLTHLGVNANTKDLLQYVKFETLESISLTDLSEADANHFRSESLEDGAFWNLKTIRLRNIHNIQALKFLLSLPMRRIFLSEPKLECLRETLANLDFSELEVLSILTKEYNWSTEAILAMQSDKFNNRMKIELGRPAREEQSEIYDENVRPLVGTKQKLARGLVEILPVYVQHERYIQAILPAHSVTK
ncbi:hypothetical protein BGZ96_008496 [Linnemannia gamsii]|uniref:RNI-like protein n=1 Tax=Linnemannia gamsii TaxID=64522 RepID=A0ABQ7JYB1_9FUNG|nr:hypothetical protein BGZ96_008496 [Linnemannia gamsii]